MGNNSFNKQHIRHCMNSDHRHLKRFALCLPVQGRLRDVCCGLKGFKMMTWINPTSLAVKDVLKNEKLLKEIGSTPKPQSLAWLWLWLFLPFSLMAYQLLSVI